MEWTLLDSLKALRVSAAWTNYVGCLILVIVGTNRNIIALLQGIHVH
jgi:hypothetical protein